MSIVELIFYLFSTVAVGGALGVITSRNPVYSVLLLVLTFFASACIWLLLEAEFLAITLVLVYVGAVMVLFLFVVMMLDIDLARLKAGFASYLPVGVLVAFAMVAQLVILFWATGTGQLNIAALPEQEGSHTRALGEWLYTNYLYPFEIAGLILLVAIVAAIMLTHRRRKGTKYQNPSAQVKVRRSERVRLVKVEPRGKGG